MNMPVSFIAQCVYENGEWIIDKRECLDIYISQSNWQINKNYLNFIAICDELWAYVEEYHHSPE